MITAANWLTLIRLVVVPLFWYGFLSDSPLLRVLATILFIGGALTDLYDGKLARKRSEETAFGNFMDQLADKLLVLSKELNELYPFTETFMISAEKGHGVDHLRKWLATEVPQGPWLYPEDQIADLPLRMIAAEMTREKLTLRLHQELPYQLTVETENWEDRKDGSVKIDQLIYVMRDGHKGILLGHKGETIKAVGKAAREELEEFLGRKVHLFLQVKVRPNWLNEAERYSEMGLNFKDGNT